MKGKIYYNSAIFRLIFTYLAILFIYSLIYIALFHLPLFIEQKVLFYRGLLLLVAATITSGFLLTLIKSKFALTYETIIPALFVSISLNLCFFVIFPVTFERSITIYLLNALNEPATSNTCQGILKDKLEQKFISEYVIKNQALSKRLTEQSEIGFVFTNNACVSITPKAKSFLSFSRVINLLYGIR
jgi:hypothetical protein